MTDRTPPLGGPGVGALVFATSYTALGVVRSLGRHGIPVWVLASGSSLASSSRYARRSIDMRGRDEDAQVELLVRMAEEHGLNGWVLFPDGDKNVAVIARHHEALGEHYALTVPPWEMVRWALDKRLTYELAARVGVDYPRTYYPASVEDLEDVDGAYPMLLKPLHHEGTDRFSIISGAWRADDREQLLDLYRQASEAVSGRPVIVVQEMIPGLDRTHVCFGALCREGRVLAHASACRTRLLPVDFGSSASDETIETIPEVEEAARRWLAGIGYTGLADMQFKYDARTGSYRLLDVNARPWLWQPTATYAGVDFPHLAWRAAQGEEVSGGPAEVGVRWVRGPYDAMSALQLIRRGDLTWRAYAGSLHGAHYEMLELDDMVPALVEVPLLFRLVWNKLQGR